MHSTKIKEYENDWATKVDESMIHISLAKSGKKGYFCLGCGEEMQAVKPRKDIQPYFRHDATNINRDKAKCVLASRTYREKIAKDFFFRSKEIGIPKIYKYPSIGVNGSAVLLKKAFTFKAHSVKSELTFYETDDGVIKWGSDPLIEDRYNLIRPDLIFFDEKGKPQFLLEIVVTHKVHDIKKEKLRRLGINCLQVIIPKKETIEIENYLQKPSNFKWIYNELEANTEYLSISNGDSEEISSIDEQQRKLLEESYNCRKSQISQLIRSITRCLRAESYRGVEKYFRSEISRIEKATETLKRQYKQQENILEQQAKIPAAQEFGDRIRANRKNKGEEQETFEKTEARHRSLEAKYFKKYRELEREEGEVEQKQINFGAAIEQERDYINEHLTEREVRDDIERQERELDEEFRLLEAEETRAIGELQQKILQPRTRAITRFRESIKSRERKIQRYNERGARLLDEEKRMGKEKKEYTDTAGSRVERSRKQILERINQRDVSRNDELSERIRAVLEIRRICGDFEDRRKLEQEYKRIIMENNY